MPSAWPGGAAAQIAAKRRPRQRPDARFMVVTRAVSLAPESRDLRRADVALTSVATICPQPAITPGRMDATHPRPYLCRRRHESEASMTQFGIGQPVRRVEDRRF